MPNHTNIANVDWIGANARYFEEDEVGMIYHGPASVMGAGGEQHDRPK